MIWLRLRRASQIERWHRRNTLKPSSLGDVRERRAHNTFIIMHDDIMMISNPPTMLQKNNDGDMHLASLVVSEHCR